MLSGPEDPDSFPAAKAAVFCPIPGFRRFYPDVPEKKRGF
jgi:hypothetical protein